MKTWLLLLVAVGLFIWADRAIERQAMRRYWNRVCTGRRWRNKFPDSSKMEVREFLDIVLDSFGFSTSRRLCFAPDDKVMELYRAVNPIEGFPDGMELEGLAVRLEERYGLNVETVWSNSVTLGELFEHTRCGLSGRAAK